MISEIVADRPPNFEKILAVFPMAAKPTVLFCYGRVLYNPSGGPVSDALMVHEGVHSERQIKMGVEDWWDRYLVDGQFRYEEELLAHRAEYRAAIEKPEFASRKWRRAQLKVIAKRLSSPLYGRIVSEEQAREAILA